VRHGFNPSAICSGYFLGSAAASTASGSQVAGRLVIPVPGVRASPAVYHNVRAHRSNHPDHVLKCLSLPPLKCFFKRFRKTEIDHACEIEVRAFDVHGGGKLRAAQDTELLALFGPDGVFGRPPRGSR